MLDLGPTGHYPHTFLVADDSYAPSFTEIIGNTVAEAMADDNNVYELQAGEMVSKTFDIKSVSLSDAQQMEITGIHELPYSEKVEYAPIDNMNNQLIATYHGKVVIRNSGGQLSAATFSKSSVERLIERETPWQNVYNEQQWYAISRVRKMGASITENDCIDHSNIGDGVLCDKIYIPIYSITG